MNQNGAGVQDPGMENEGWLTYRYIYIYMSCGLAGLTLDDEKLKSI